MNLKRLKARSSALFGRIDRRLGSGPSLLLRSALAFDQDDGPLVARSIAYYALFAVFPAILVLVVVASRMLEAEEVQETVMDLVAQFLPMAYELVAANIEQLLAARDSVGLVALVGLVWSASGVFSAVFRAVNRAWGIPKAQLVVTGYLWGLIMMSVVGVFLLLALSIGPVITVIRTWQVPGLDWEPLSRPGTDRLVGWLSELVPGLLSIGAFILLYRTLPRTQVRWGDVWLGGLIAGLVWELGKRLFGWYVSTIATYNLIYGSVGAIIAFLLWSYLSAQLLLAGAEFTVVYGRWRRAGRPLETRALADWTADPASLKVFKPGG